MYLIGEKGDLALLRGLSQPLPRRWRQVRAGRAGRGGEGAIEVGEITAPAGHSCA